jgi:4'-phosphopantetheinyl transferase
VDRHGSVGDRSGHGARLKASLSRLPAVSIAETLALGGGIVDLWYCFLEADDAQPLGEYEGLMTADERERHASFRFERDRRLFLATRALVRTVLSRYAAVRPGDWRFAAGPHGKPRIAHPAVTRSLHFNLANTRGLVVCAVSVAHESIGVDAERLDRAMDPVELASRFFAPPEAQALGALPAPEQSRRFFTYWTLKESYIKARGLGLALPLDKFWFLVDDEAIGIRLDAELEQDATRLRFALLDAPPCHMIAVGVDTGGLALSLRAARVEPFSGRAHGEGPPAPD